MARLVLGRRRPLRPGGGGGWRGSLGDRESPWRAADGGASGCVALAGPALAGRVAGLAHAEDAVGEAPGAVGELRGLGLLLAGAPCAGPRAEVRGAWGDEGALGGGDFLPSGRSVCASATGGGSPETGLEPRAPGTAPSVGPSGRCRAPVKGRRWVGRV